MPDDAATKRQLDRFHALRDPLRLERSIANSAGILAWPDAHGDWVRPGLMLYGVSPFAERSAAELGLQPAMTLHDAVDRRARRRGGRSASATAAPGARSALSASRLLRSATAMAIRAACGNGTPVLINGREAPIVGRVSMDMTMLDVTDLPDAQVGDEVTLWGQGLPAERVAPCADTIAVRAALPDQPARDADEWSG